MKTLKDWLLPVFGVIFVIAFFGGIIWFIWWDYNSDTAAYVKQCQAIAKLADAKEYKAGYGECFIVKDGKIVEIEL